MSFFWAVLTSSVFKYHYILTLLSIMLPTLIRPQLVKPSFSSSVPPLLQRLLSQRGIACDKDINTELSGLADPFLMKGMQAVSNRLYQALMKQQKVMIVGDFDADGATSTALLLLAFKQLGFKQVGFMVPNRFEYGYGLSEEIVDELAKQQPDLLVTVDNGISSLDGVDKANALGIDVIITDHHLPGNHLPQALAIINPNQPGCRFPTKNLAGVGVAFHCLIALRKTLREANWFHEHGVDEPNLADYLDLVALGTVADVVPLDFYNRILVAQGIKRMRAGKMRLGLKQLLHLAGKNHQHLCSSDMGFVLGPRLNAAGRLDDMSLGIILLTTDSESLATELAQQLDAFNRDRRLIETQMQDEAMTIIDQLNLHDNQLPRALCLFHEDWHQGVVGLVASRLKEKFHRPVIAFAYAESTSQAGEFEIKGSGRSIAGIHLRDVLDEVASSHPGLLNKFGGHAMAAGLSIKVDDFEYFKSAFSTVLDNIKDESIFARLITTDGELSSFDLNLYNATMIRDAMPWGQALPEPSFEGQFYLKGFKVLKDKHLKCQLSLTDESSELYSAIFFNADVAFWQMQSINEPLLVHVAYQLNVNTFRGESSLQLMINAMDLKK